jgi:hypothetical protein
MALRSLNLTDTGHSRGTTIALPLGQREIDQLQPSNFARVIAEHIRDCEWVVTVVSSEDQSPPVEAAMASYLAKPQILVGDRARVPRILAGLPEVQQVLSGQDLDAVREQSGTYLAPRSTSWPAVSDASRSSAVDPRREDSGSAAACWQETSDEPEIIRALAEPLTTNRSRGCARSLARWRVPTLSLS